MRQTSMRAGTLLMLASTFFLAGGPPADVRAADLYGGPSREIGGFSPAYNWTGFYYGGSVGGGFSTTEFQRGGGSSGLQLDANGITASIYGGYNYMMPSLWVIGVEAEYGLLDIDAEPTRLNGQDAVGITTSAFGTLRGRLGYAFGRFLPYVTAGFAFVDVENSGGNPASNQQFVASSNVSSGFTVGAGAEYAITPNLIGRLDYSYIDTEDIEVRNGANQITRFDNEFHLVRAGLALRF